MGLALALATSALVPILGVLPASAAVLTTHAPIVITGNAGFNATNGVVSGTGTAADPYVIAGWAIDAPPSMGVQIRNTDAHAIVRDVAVASAPTDGFYAYAVSNLTLSNITAEGGLGEGIRLESCRDVAILSSNVTANLAGIVLIDSANVSVVANSLTLNLGDGVTVLHSTAVVLRANRFTNNALLVGYDLDLASSRNATVSANRFAASGIYLNGTAAPDYASHTITADNVVSGLPIVYEANEANLTLSGLVLGELLLANCSRTSASNLTVLGGGVGIEAAFSGQVVLGPNVTISDARLGLRVVSSSGVRLIGGSILDSAAGARIESSSDVTVANTKVSAPFLSSPPADGVAVLGSARINLTDNVVRHYRNGISVSASDDTSLVGNVLSRDIQGALVQGSTHLVALGNLFVQDGTGLRADQVTNATVRGNAFEGSAIGVNVSASSGMRFAHNAFVNDHSNAYDANGTADAWDDGYPAGGNFWWIYRGPDACSGPLQDNCTGPDGIGDTPYIFEVNASDRYPLVQDPVAGGPPPEALFLASPPAGTVITPLAASANLSSDYEDPLAQLQVRWDWEGNGSWTPWTVVKYATHRYRVAGMRTLILEVRDLAGLTDTWAVEVYIAPKPDNLPPAIVTAPAPAVDVDRPIPIVANITDSSGVANATLLFRGVDGGPFASLPMQLQGDGVDFTATIPAQPHAGTVEYVIVANDTWQNEARAPLRGFSTITVVDPTVRLLLAYVVPAAVVAAAAAFGFLWFRHRRGKGPPENAPSPPPGNP